jgi:hypothetical protein
MSGIAQLGPVILPQADFRVDSRRAGRKDLAEQGLLSSGAVRVDQVSNQAGDVTLSGRFRPPIPEDRVPMVAREFSELVSSDIGPLALFDQQGDTRAESGYYEIESGDVEPVHPSQPEIQEFSVSLKQVGRRGSHYRALRYQETDVSGVNPFYAGAIQAIYPTLPADPSRADPGVGKLQWYDERTGETDRAQTDISRSVILSDQDLHFQPRPHTTTVDPTHLLYDIALEYDMEGAYVFDTRGRTDKTDGNGTRQWQAVFDASHERREGAEFVLSSKKLRIYLSGPPNPTLSAERYSGRWNSISIPSTAYEIVDIDFKSISPQRIRAEVRMSDGSEVVALLIDLPYGMDSVGVYVPPDQPTPLPVGVRDRWNPIADSRAIIRQPERVLIPKREVRR